MIYPFPTCLMYCGENLVCHCPSAVRQHRCFCSCETLATNVPINPFSCSPQICNEVHSSGVDRIYWELYLRCSLLPSERGFALHILGWSLLFRHCRLLFQIAVLTKALWNKGGDLTKRIGLSLSLWHPSHVITCALWGMQHFCELRQSVTSSNVFWEP